MDGYMTPRGAALGNNDRASNHNINQEIEDQIWCVLIASERLTHFMLCAAIAELVL